MNHSEFKIGGEFTIPNGSVWRCTDIGTRTILAIRVDQAIVETMSGGRSIIEKLTRAEAEARNWFSGPPYGVVEPVFDEDEQESCEPASTKKAPTQRGHPPRRGKSSERQSLRYYIIAGIPAIVLRACKCGRRSS